MYAVADVTMPHLRRSQGRVEAVLLTLGEFIDHDQATYNVFKPFGDAVSGVVSSIFGSLRELAVDGEDQVRIWWLWDVVPREHDQLATIGPEVV